MYMKMLLLTAADSQRFCLQWTYVDKIQCWKPSKTGMYYSFILILIYYIISYFIILILFIILLYLYLYYVLYCIVICIISILC
jgi:hypothetical protein